MESAKNGEKQAENGQETAKVQTPAGSALFDRDLGERSRYEAALASDEVYLPITRDGYEALLERCCKEFIPPLPVDDSTRSVFSGWCHHISNDVCTVTVKQLANVLYKSISNALTYEIDQESKARRQAKFAAAQAEAKKKFEAEQKALAESKAEDKRAKKATKRVSLAGKSNGAPKITN